MFIWQLDYFRIEKYCFTKNVFASFGSASVTTGFEQIWSKIWYLCTSTITTTSPPAPPYISSNREKRCIGFCIPANQEKDIKSSNFAILLQFFLALNWQVNNFLRSKGMNLLYFQIAVEEHGRLKKFLKPFQIPMGGKWNNCSHSKGGWRQSFHSFSFLRFTFK